MSAGASGEPDASAASGSRAAVECVARTSYGKLVAYLSVRSRDIAAAEDALGDAFRAALEQWPRVGVPERPESWLLTAARRRLIDAARRADVRRDAWPSLRAAAEEATAVVEASEIPDERLALLFACAHPAVQASARTPLLLQAVLGLDAKRIASAFLVAPSAMSQRLVRAKTKIRAAGIPFDVPGEEALAERLDVVLDAIYAAYGTGWNEGPGAARGARGLAAEAVQLSRVVTRLLPDAAEAWGLLALLLFCESRAGARRTPDGAFVPLTEQDTARWDASLIAEAETALGRAAALRAPRRFQLEAAIQSVHAARVGGGVTDWALVAGLYDRLLALAPALGVAVARAAAHAEAHGAPAGWSLLEQIDAAAVAAYQPYWAVRAHLAAGRGHTAEARAAYRRAAGLTEDESVRRFLLARAAALPAERQGRPDG